MVEEYGKEDKDFIKKHNISVEFSCEQHITQKELHDNPTKKYKTEIHKTQMRK